MVMGAGRRLGRRGFTKRRGRENGKENHKGLEVKAAVERHEPPPGVFMWLLFTVLVVICAMVVWATLTTWWIPGGYQVPEHGADWILAGAIAAAVALGSGMLTTVPDITGTVSPDAVVTPFRYHDTVPGRRIRIRAWLLRYACIQIPRLVVACLLAAWLYAMWSNLVQWSTMPGRRQLDGWGVGWMLIINTIILCTIAMLIHRARGYTKARPSLGWVRWAYGHALPPMSVEERWQEVMELLESDAPVAMYERRKQSDVRQSGIAPTSPYPSLGEMLSSSWEWVEYLLTQDTTGRLRSQASTILLTGSRENRIRMIKILGKTSKESTAKQDSLA